MAETQTILSTWLPEPRPVDMHITLHGEIASYACLGPRQREQGRALRELRTAYGLYLGQAAKVFGLTVVELSECESGIRNFDIDEARHILFRRVT